MSEEITLAASDLSDLDRLRDENERLRAMLDTERQLHTGRYAFYHRHLALSYVRKHNPGLHTAACAQAMRQIDADGGKSYQDVVAELEELYQTAADRARIASAAYQRQQDSQRELEVLYQAAVAGAQLLADVVRTYVQRETTCLPIEKADSAALGRVVDALAAYDAVVKVRQ